mgnify:CR=1 FL=1
MSENLLQENQDQENNNFLNKPKIIIFGVGGAGGNAINNMINSDLQGVEFVAANTDSQSLENSLAKNKIQLGVSITKGLGAGSFPEKGRDAAEENIQDIKKYLEGANMVFISAGMGGGTGTGAAPVIAKLAREQDILTVGVVTKPFYFEGSHRMEVAEEGVEELKKHVDTLIVIPNQNLFRVSNEQTTFESAFKMADAVLHAGVRGVTDLITIPGIVNLDFADIRTVMTKMGKAMMGTGEASGENRAIIACEEAISNPLLDDVSIKGAKGVLVNMTGGSDMTLYEADSAVTAIKKEVDSKANIIFGTAFDKNMNGSIRVSVVATGIESDSYIKNHHNTSLIDDLDLALSSKEREVRKSSLFEDDIVPKVDREIDLANGIDGNIEIGNDPIGNYSVDQEEDFDNEFKPNNQIDFDDFIEQSENNALNNSDLLRSKNDNSEAMPKYENQDVNNKKQASKNTKDNQHDSGFKLFRFMNNVKSKNKNSKSNTKYSGDSNIDLDQKNTEIFVKSESDLNDSQNSSMDSKFSKLKEDKIFFDSRAMSNDNPDSAQKKIDDDIMNVPAFFRRKK